jgi:cell division protein FtsI (penicillin-binding protein 3)
VEGSEIDPENGKDIVTTIDVNIQDIAENALLRMLIENECDHGTCIVMEVATGKIKAMANLGRRTDGSYWEDLNYAIRASEPGSTFKLATLLSVLEDGYTTLDKHVNLEGGKWKVRSRTVFDSEEHGLYDVTVKSAFEHSSNVGMAKLAVSYYSSNPEQFIGHLKKLHLDQHSGVGLVGETNPIIKTPKSKTWSATTLPWMAFGYEVLVSPLQTLMLYNAVANNGKMMKPYLVNAIQDNGITITKHEPELLEESICSEETLRQLKLALEGVVLEGTGKELRSPYYSIAGKTGTALVANGRHGYADHIYQSSFAGYFPADRPLYSCIVVIKNKPHAKKFYGAAVAGPVFREIADKLNALHAEKNGIYLSKDSIRRDSADFYYAGETTDMRFLLHSMNSSFLDSSAKSDWSSFYSDNHKPVMSAREVSRQAMPNVKGMGLKDALYLLETMNLKVNARGRGKVTSQSPEVGVALNKNQQVSIGLN